MLLSPSCRKSMDLSEDDLPKTESSSTSDIDPTNAADDVATFTGSYNIAISYSGTSATIAITDTLGNALSAIDSLEIIIHGAGVTVNGGYVISRGGSINSFVTTSSKAFVQTTTSANAKVGLVSSSTQILAYQAPSSGGTTTLFCTPEMTANNSYTLYTGVSSITVQNEDFPRFGVGFSGGSSGSSLTASSSAGSSGPGGGGPGGGGPGGGGRP